MQEITEILKTDNYLLILSIIVLILFIGVIVLLIKKLYEKIRKWQGSRRRFKQLYV